MPSVMQRIGTPNPRHNQSNKYRKHLENVDPNLSKYNKVIRHKSVEKIYQEYLQPAFDDYNKKQKRKDRRYDVKYSCKTYLEYQRELDKRARASKNTIDQKGRPPIREIIWQIGNPKQGYGCLEQTNESRAKVEEMLLECQFEAERRYTHFVWGDVVFHADEVSEDANGNKQGSLHLHAAFVPLCYQNKQGPTIQVAFERCLKEMGFNSFQEWKHDLDQLMEEVLHKHGLERVIMDNHEEHQNSTEYHRQQRLIKQTKEYEQQQQELKSETETIAKQGQEYIEQYKEEVKELRKEIGELEDNILELQDQQFFLMTNINSIIENETGLLEEMIDNTVDNVLTNQSSEYNDFCLYMSYCSDEEREEISEKINDMKGKLVRENVNTDAMEVGLDIFVNQLKNQSVSISWKERQEFWNKYFELTKAYWDVLPDLQKDYKIEISKAYDENYILSQAYYDTLHTLRTTNNIFVMLYMAIKALFLGKKKEDAEYNLNDLIKERKKMIKSTASFKGFCAKYREELKQGKAPNERYLKAMTRLVKMVDERRYEFDKKRMNLNDVPTEHYDR